MLVILRFVCCIASAFILAVNVKSDNIVEERVVLTDEQQEEFLSIARNRYYYEVYLIMLSTGIRVGEMTALSWDDVDFENKVIHIRHSMQTAYECGKKIMNMTTPKTANSVRAIPMFDGVEKAFLDWKKKQDESKKKVGKRWRLPDEFSNLIFTTSLGSPLTRYVLTGDINKILKIIEKEHFYVALSEHCDPVEFPKVHPHAFRHTFATRCFEKELKPLFIMKIMGHSNYETTMSYTHVLKKTSDEQVIMAGSFIQTEIVA